MSFQDEISKAIGAHGQWKTRLRSAIDSGQSDLKPADVAKDNLCAFGQWLYGTSVPPTARMSSDFVTVQRLHADFHRCAARVVEHVSGGRKAEADALMSGEYSQISADLTVALMKWRGGGG